LPSHVVKQGECLASIGAQYGFTSKALWALSENAALRNKRKNPHILLPGDRVFVPQKDPKNEGRPVDQRHKFVKHQLVKLKICLLAAGKPIANQGYVLKVGGKNLQGTTDASGILEKPIPADATDATLVLGLDKLELQLKIGSLDPSTEATGVQGRLNNLGFHCGAVDGIVGPLTKSALMVFQETYQLKQTGKIDDATREKLRSLHGC
jgi:hypothetical protein